ncbi:hypothetical protein [Halobacillus sp. BBL2006]|uniref:hypothetical protein n=1 Tax=Halobacillus sp. BBL2006 TaxID=1543706 RepID=UPI000A471093|nr:hypothetical protein [Halobacillus sp. BBL2006]
MAPIGAIIYLLFILLLAFVIRWIRMIKKNTDKQVEQNEELLALLKELKRDKVN